MTRKRVLTLLAVYWLLKGIAIYLIVSGQAHCSSWKSPEEPSAKHTGTLGIEPAPLSRNSDGAGI